jgi:predicted enzyme related to lactoylglutathione lyase
MIPNLTIGDLMIDCADAGRTRDFYAGLMGCEKTVAFDCLALKTDSGMTILFAETDIPYAPPVWPEEPGTQQKQMHLDFTVDDLPSSVEEAVRLGAAKAAVQYGGEYFVNMLDPEGRPFCLCKRQGKSEFDLYFEKKGYSAIPSPSINIDCKKTELLRSFYAQLTTWDREFHWSALIADNGLVVHFMECDGDFDYIPPVWPEEPGKQQKQMHFNFQVDDLQSAVEEAVRLGAARAAAQYGGGHFITLLDTEGHPFCLCKRQ